MYWEGSLVFAKVKGHPYWPAEITKVINSEKTVKYNVTFFGDNTTALIKQSDMCLYYEYKHIHGKPKIDNLKNKEFNSALELAEIASNNMKETPQANEQINISNTIEEKIQNIESIDEIGLETSLNLAVEAGNALVQENSTLREELQHLQEKVLRLEGMLADKDDIIEKMEVRSEKYKNKIEELNWQTEDLNNQLIKEKGHALEVQKLYEDNDIEQSRIINSHIKNIVKLERTISALKLKLENQLETVHRDEVSVSDTPPHTTQPTSNTPQLINQTILPTLDFKTLLFRQDHMELEIYNIKKQMEQHTKMHQETLTQNTNEQEVKLPSRNVKARSSVQVNSLKPNFNTSYTQIKRKNHFSVSLQVKKSKSTITPHIEITKPYKKPKENISQSCIEFNQITKSLNKSPHPLPFPKLQNYNESCQQTSKRLGNKKPPLLAKIRQKEESCEEFFLKHIHFYKEHMTGSWSYMETESNVPCPENRAVTGLLDPTLQPSKHQSFESHQLQNLSTPPDTQIEHVLKLPSTSQHFLEINQPQSAPT